MNPLVSQRCLHHGEREAVARCLECQCFFCRECIVEHNGRVLCAGCQANIQQTRARRGGRLRAFAVGCHLLLSVGLLWFCFFLLGKVLLSIPSSFHEGDAWKSRKASYEAE